MLGVWEECGSHIPKCEVSGKEREYVEEKGPTLQLKEILLTKSM